MPFECKPKVEFFITTKAELATKKVNKWLEENYDEIDVLEIKPFMSYSGEKGYMVGCMIEYLDKLDTSMVIGEVENPIMNWKEESDGVSAEGSVF